jgi:uncharacterized protein (TIGR00297 family)
MQLSSLALAYGLAAMVGYAGYRAKALTVDGAVAACLVGGTIFGFGGLGWAVLLVLFFAASSALSFFKASDARKRRAAETFDKGGRRDAAQVLANGGVAALISLLVPFAGEGTLPILFGAYVGALAAATADTWSTEIGVLSAQSPRLITNWKQVAAGTSGGVTLLGSAAALAGALFMGLAASLLNVLLPDLGVPVGGLSLLAGALLGGLAGAFADSLLGASVQAGYWCPRCDKPTESRLHRCGTPTQLVRGLRFVDNDVVNLLATLVGAVVGGLVLLAAP